MYILLQSGGVSSYVMSSGHRKWDRGVVPISFSSEYGKYSYSRTASEYGKYSYSRAARLTY